VVTLKGRAACEIDTADELVASELLLNGTLSGLEPAQLVALAACLIPVEKSTEQIKLTAQMAGPLSQLQAAARHIAEVSRECKLELDPDEYVESFKPALMDVIYAWSKGATFAQVCDMTDIFEGSLVRATRRLDELLGQLGNAAAAVGDHELAAKIRAAAETIRRDIMFAASLYI
ncbi:Superkiller viralicidic activity 2-like 2, partial [Tetrabaena socialis]